MALALYNGLSAMLVLLPRPLRFGTALNAATFMSSLLATELAWMWLLLQALTAGILVAFGALESQLGRIAGASWLAAWLVLGWCHWQSVKHAPAVIEKALRAGLGNRYRDRVPQEILKYSRTPVRFTDWRNPIGYRSVDVVRIDDIQYLGGGIRQRLDIYRPRELPTKPCPVLLQIHGGAWIMGHKAQQALPLLYELARRGWICVAANYRLSPSVSFPTHLEDCKSALCWIRERGQEYGMDAAFVAVTGGSAGGHLAALMGLTANMERLQQSHPGVDTSVQACIPFYGNYDFLSPSGHEPSIQSMRRFLTDNIMHVSPEQGRALWQLASPIVQAHEQAPPFMIVHGSKDSLLPVAGARLFRDRLQEVSGNPVVYVELPGAEHAFDTFRSVRTHYVIDGVHRFLEWVRASNA